ncbi:MAG: BadF/BadG/BcrA/BcrD ATPase family protein [Niameybacter sp.]
MYLLGLDGGETKTHCIIGDEEGNIFAEGFGGPANYHTVGLKTTKSSIDTAISRALSKLNITIADIVFGIIGLAGVDCEEDFKCIDEVCREIFGENEFKVYNDCWLVLRAGSKENWGIVSVCGMGHGCMGKTKEGEKVELRNMVYALGNRGGNTEMAWEALHHAFRADEGIGQATKLQYEIPRVLGVRTMNEVIHMLREKGEEVEGWVQIAMTVYRLAREQDEVAQDIVIVNGQAVGRTAAAVIQRLGLQRTEVPIVIGGSAFAEENSLFLDAYKLEVHRVAPNARFIPINKRPVIGAYYLAMDHLKNASNL